MLSATANEGQYSTFVSLDCKSAVLSLNFWLLDTKILGQYSTFVFLDCKSAVLSLNFWFLNTKIRDSTALLCLWTAKRLFFP